jgi:hypothetical protein
MIDHSGQRIDFAIRERVPSHLQDNNPHMGPTKRRCRIDEFTNFVASVPLPSDSSEHDTEHELSAAAQAASIDALDA